MGLLEREVESLVPPRTRYRLIEAGRELEAVITATGAWARENPQAPVGQVPRPGPARSGFGRCPIPLPLPGTGGSWPGPSGSGVPAGSPASPRGLPRP
ncbi:winged helix-turn-helix transcriptional regulator [Thermus altitudinis]|uniref:winged helix-turn-helix transcriptional regulator n=1 Tax=Thermus altitudinis TaxID=2908145 RepID=UPI003C12BEDC